VILPDTSAWVEYDRRTGSAVDLRIDGLIRSDGELTVTEPVIMEVLAGARSERRAADLRMLMARFPLLSIDADGDFESAAAIYRHCRRAGVTPRGLLDCLIAAVAWRSDAAILSYNRDMVGIAGVMGIKLDPASR
jgi:predicted nucleic acid-binding protein